MPSQAYLSAVNARVNREILVTLIHIAHPEIDPDAFPDGIRVHDGGETVEDTLVSGGITYVPWAFRVRRPDRRSGAVAGIPIEVDNVHPAYGRAILPLTSPPTVTLTTVLKSTPDIVEEGPMTFSLVAVRVTRTTITGELAWATGLGMRYPRHRYTPATAPGLFR